MGTSLEGFEEQITELLLAIGARKKNKKFQAVNDQMKQGKLGQKSQRELKNLLTSMNVEVGSTKSRNVRSRLWWFINEFEDYFLEC